MDTKSQKTVAGFLRLACEDYLAARLLLRQGLLIAAIPIAAQCIEKAMKAALISKSHTVSKQQHLCPALIATFKKINPGFIDSETEDFLCFLAKGYKLRYAHTESEGYTIVINQYRTLMALDKAFSDLDKPFKLMAETEETATPYRAKASEQNALLTQDNWIFNPEVKNEILTRANMVVEIGMGGRYREIDVTYLTEGVSSHGSFLKKPNFTKDKESFQVTFG
ncbi:MAG: HEPN domain-containing protein [Lysobacter sp.]|nr:HEPN domain-containing protein [Lysobacter sp.]